MKFDKNIEIKALEDSSNLLISGYASCFENVDHHNDIIQKGCFANSLLNDKSIKLLWQHDAKYPIGKINKLKEDNYGLYFEAEILSTLAKGREVIELIKNHIIDSVSIGFRAIESYLNNDSVRVITKAELFEISLVTFPANNQSKISNIKKYNNEFNTDLYRSVLDAKNTFITLKEIMNGRS